MRRSRRGSLIGGALLGLAVVASHLGTGSVGIADAAPIVAMRTPAPGLPPSGPVPIPYPNTTRAR